MTAPGPMDAARDRWRAWRAPLHLVDPSKQDFATGGLSSYVQDLSVRFLALPRDVDATIVEFDDDLWKWWESKRTTRVETAGVEWGRESRPVSDAVLHFEAAVPDSEPSKMDQYLALYRSGAVEFASGWGTATTDSDDGRQFLLIATVVRLQAALEVLAEASERWKLTGPWELNLALRTTARGVLANVATGYLEPDNPELRSKPRRALEPHVLLRLEIENSVTKAQSPVIAERFGGWVENAFGSRSRRFIARKGPREGKLDVGRFNQ